jgi:hypothetical protein
MPGIYQVSWEKELKIKICPIDCRTGKALGHGLYQN